MPDRVTYDSKRLCTTKAKCQELGYALRIQCPTQKQCEARGYYQIDEETHMCVTISTCPEG